MTVVRLLGASLLLAAGIVFLRSYGKYERERIKTACSLLAFLRRATDEARAYLTPISEIVSSTEDELLIERGFVSEYKQTLSLSSAYKRVAGRYSGRVFSLLEEALSRLGGRIPSPMDNAEIDRISAEAEIERECAEKNIKIRGTLTIAAVLGIIILFL